MKQYVLNGLVVAGIALTSLPAFAQKDKEAKKTEEKQIIVINRNGATDEKVLIELSPGGKVLINGKEAKDEDNVSVNVTRIKDGDHFMGLNTPGGGNWNFNFDHDRMSFFSEDSNRAMLGIVTDIDDKGAEVVTVNKESAAEKAGLKKGDIITRIGDKKIEDADDVTTAVRSHKPGEQVGITILRDGKEQKLTAKLDRYKGVSIRGMAPSRVFGGDVRATIPRVPNTPLRLYGTTSRPRLGLSIQDTDDGKGVKVLDVAEEGNAAKAGIKEGDVITHVDTKAVNSADEITTYLKEQKDKTSLRLQVLRNGKSQNIEVKMPRKLKTADL